MKSTVLMDLSESYMQATDARTKRVRNEKTFKNHFWEKWGREGRLDGAAKEPWYLRQSICLIRSCSRNDLNLNFEQDIETIVIIVLNLKMQ